MTDINEIIGRALLTLNNANGPGLPSVIGDSNDGSLPGALYMDGAATFDDIGAAVVKALGEAGYEITQAAGAVDTCYRREDGTFGTVKRKC